MSVGNKHTSIKWALPPWCWSASSCSLWHSSQCESTQCYCVNLLENKCLFFWQTNNKYLNWTLFNLLSGRNVFNFSIIQWFRGEQLIPPRWPCVTHLSVPDWPASLSSSLSFDYFWGMKRAQGEEETLRQRHRDLPSVPVCVMTNGYSWQPLMDTWVTRFISSEKHYAEKKMARGGFQDKCDLNIPRWGWVYPQLSAYQAESPFDSPLSAEPSLSNTYLLPHYLLSTAIIEGNRANAR